MQKRTYQNLEQEQNIEMGSYSDSIPVGQPITSYPNDPQINPYAQQPPFYPQHPQYPPHHHAPPHHLPPPHHAPHMMPPHMHQVPPPPMQNAILNNQNYNYPTTLVCPCCKNQVLTVVNLESGNTTYMWCVGIGLCISPLFCCLPFLMESCLDKSHYCPNCGHNILRKHQKCFEFAGC